MKKLLIIFITVVSFVSCKTGDEAIPETGTVCIINVMTDAGAIKSNFSGKSIAWSSIIPTVAFGVGKFYYPPAGNSNMKVVSALDTNVVLFNASSSIKSTVYTLYLTGTKVAVDTMFRKEVNFPFIATGSNIPPSADSVVNVRFVNLSTGSPALKIKLTSALSNEVNNLPFMAIGDWKGYANKTDFTEYNFEIRNAETGELLTTYTFYAMATNRFKNVTLVIRGTFGTTGATGFGVSEVNYF